MVSDISWNWWLVANSQQQSAQNSAGIQTLLDVGIDCLFERGEILTIDLLGRERGSEDCAARYVIYLPLHRCRYK